LVILCKFLSARWDKSWIWCENLCLTKPIPLRAKKSLRNETTGKNRKKFTKLSWLRSYLGTNQFVHSDNCWSSCIKLMKTIFTQFWVKKYLGNEAASQERQEKWIIIITLAETRPFPACKVLFSIQASSFNLYLVMCVCNY